MLYLEALNEKGSVCWRDSEAGVLEFRYSNQFCGSCRFVARVIETPDRGLCFAHEDLVWEDFSLKRGNPPALYKSALVFFDQYFKRQRSVADFHRRVSRPSGPGLREVIRRFLFGRGAASPAPTLEGNGHKPGTMAEPCQQDQHQQQDQEEGGLQENLNGNGRSKEELPVLELNLKRPRGVVSFDFDFSTKEFRPQKSSMKPKSNGKRENAEPGSYRDRRTPMLPFVD